MAKLSQNLDHIPEFDSRYWYNFYDYIVFITLYMWDSICSIISAFSKWCMSIPEEIFDESIVVSLRLASWKRANAVCLNPIIFDYYGK